MLTSRQNHGNSRWHRFKWGWTNPADQTHQCEEELSPRHRFGYVWMQLWLRCSTRALSSGCLPKDLLFFSLQNFRLINHNRQFLKGPEVFGFFFPLCFFLWLSCPVRFPCYLQHFWSWKLPFKRYFATFWSANLSFSVVFATFWCSTYSCRMVFCNWDSFK